MCCRRGVPIEVRRRIFKVALEKYARLSPHHANVAKRVVKSPKVYFTDVGLASYLLGLEEETQVSRDPLRGQLFENMVVMDVRKGFANRGRDPRMAVYRTEKGFEVDLIVSRGSRVRPIEGVRVPDTSGTVRLVGMVNSCGDRPSWRPLQIRFLWIRSGMTSALRMTRLRTRLASGPLT